LYILLMELPQKAKIIDIKDDPDYDLYGLVNMFTDTDYKRIDYEYGDIKMHINALKSASTDTDLTGQIVW